MKKGLLYITLLLLVVGCRLDRTKDQEPLGSMSLPVTISLPMENTYAQRLIRRSIGDPGKDERFARPKHVYFFVLKYDGENWSVWHKEHREPADEDWTPKRYSGSLSTSGDSIYEYNRPINLLLSNEKFEGQVFVIASAKELEFNTPFASITTADQVRNLQFNVAEPNTNANLQDIYSSPYNYEVNGSYYGSFSSIYQKVPHVNLMLYHVAAKVDIKWSVAESLRINKDHPENAIRLTYMKAKNLFNGYAYCFKPMKNERAAILATGDVVSIITPLDEGLWWEGRAYFYTIPYTVTDNPSYFPLQMEMSTNGSSDKYRPTLNMQVNTSSPFVPWMRAMFNINTKLEDKSETKIIDL